MPRIKINPSSRYPFKGEKYEEEPHCLISDESDQREQNLCVRCALVVGDWRQSARLVKDVVYVLQLLQTLPSSGKWWLVGRRQWPIYKHWPDGWWVASKQQQQYQIQ